MSNPNGLSDTILVLGDETKSAHALQRLLRTAGYEARAVDCFEAAHESLASQTISLIIIEPASSRLTGKLEPSSEESSGESLRRLEWSASALEFCETVRSEQRTEEIPILIISKSKRSHDKVAFLNRGATDYISKPIPRNELLSRVRGLLRSLSNEREKTERFEQLNLLHSVSSVLASSLEPEVLLKGTLSVLISYMRADAGAVFLRNPETGAMTIVATEGIKAGEEDEKRLLDFYDAHGLANGGPAALL